MTENERKTSLLRPSLLVSGVTLLSRLLGIIRVRLEASVLGGGELASAWFLAFAIPNLFRRLLGEGALGTALIPLIAGIEQEQTLIGSNHTFTFFRHTRIAGGSAE